MYFNFSTEAESNRIALIVNAVACLLILFFDCLGWSDIYTGAPGVLLFATMPPILLTFIAAAAARFCGLACRPLRYLNLFIALIFPATTVAIAGNVYLIAFAVPLMLASCYLDRTLLWVFFAVILVFIVAANALNIWFGGVPDYNTLVFPEGTILPWRFDFEEVAPEIGYLKPESFASAVFYNIIPSTLFLALATFLADRSICIGRARAESAEAFSKGILDSMSGLHH